MVTMMTRQMNNASLRHLSDDVFVLCDICRHGRQTCKRCGKVSAEAKDRKRVSFSVKRQTSRRKSQIEK